MRKALILHHQYPCVRVGKTLHALRDYGWEHDVVAPAMPPQLIDLYKHLDINPLIDYAGYVEKVKRSDAEIIVVHNEPNWPVLAAKEGANGRPVVFVVHDITCARPNVVDPWEAKAYEAADGFVFISEEQRAFAIQAGLPVEGKPYCCVGNYALSDTYIDKTPLPHLGGVVYEGGLDPRGSEFAWRDLSPVADAISEFHVYPGNPGIDYGIVHETCYQYRTLIHRLAQYDWGFTGTTQPLPAWSHSIPNKVFDYLAAGIPFIALNNPLVGPLCEAGLGIYCNDLKDVARAAKTDPKPYRKRVLAQRGQWSMQNRIAPMAELYDTLIKGERCEKILPSTA